MTMMMMTMMTFKTSMTMMTKMTMMTIKTTMTIVTMLSSLRTVGQNSMEVKTFSQQYVPGNFDLSSMNSTKQGLEIENDPNQEIIGQKLAPPVISR